MLEEVRERSSQKIDGPKIATLSAEKFNRKYRKGKKLGEGSSAKVFECTTDESVVIKEPVERKVEFVQPLMSEVEAIRRLGGCPEMNLGKGMGQSSMVMKPHELAIQEGGLAVAVPRVGGEPVEELKRRIGDGLGMEEFEGWIKLMMLNTMFAGHLELMNIRDIRPEQINARDYSSSFLTLALVDLGGSEFLPEEEFFETIETIVAEGEELGKIQKLIKESGIGTTKSKRMLSQIEEIEKVDYEETNPRIKLKEIKRKIMAFKNLFYDDPGTIRSLIDDEEGQIKMRSLAYRSEVRHLTGSTVGLFEDINGKTEELGDILKKIMERIEVSGVKQRLEQIANQERNIESYMDRAFQLDQVIRQWEKEVGGGISPNYCVSEDSFENRRRGFNRASLAGDFGRVRESFRSFEQSMLERFTASVALEVGIMCNLSLGADVENSEVNKWYSKESGEIQTLADLRQVLADGDKKVWNATFGIS